MTDTQDPKTSAPTATPPEVGADAAPPQGAASPDSWVDAMQRRALLFALFVLTVGVGLVAMVLSGAYLAYRYTEPTVVATVPAGRVLGVQLHGGLFSRGLVETDIGFYSLEEGASFLKGELLTLQERGNRSRFLCDATRHCTRLLRPLE